MIVSYISDLHLEHDPFYVPSNPDNASVLVLAGDILIVEDIKRFPFGVVRDDTDSERYTRSTLYQKFFERLSDLYDHIIYVPGNHEFYGGEYFDVRKVLEQNLKVFPKVHLLWDDKFTIDDVTFIGATLWTDMNRGDPLTKFEVGTRMNDYRTVRYKVISNYSKFTPDVAARVHQLSLSYIKSCVADEINRNPEQKIVVVTHHGPTHQSIAPAYIDHRLMNGGYVSELSEFIETSNISHWIHGHIHHIHNYTVGNTTILCNPNGYPSEIDQELLGIKSFTI